jgi:hypothetical protein
MLGQDSDNHGRGFGAPGFVDGDGLGQDGLIQVGAQDACTIKNLRQRRDMPNSLMEWMECANGKFLVSYRVAITKRGIVEAHLRVRPESRADTWVRPCIFAYIWMSIAWYYNSPSSH